MKKVSLKNRVVASPLGGAKQSHRMENQRRDCHWLLRSPRNDGGSPVKKGLLSFLTFALVFSGACAFKDDDSRPVYSLYRGQPGTAAVRNFRETQALYSGVTGVPPNNASVSSYYNSAKTRLPSDGNVETLSPANLLANAALAGVYCTEFIKADALVPPTDRRAHTLIDFSMDQDSLSQAAMHDVVGKYANLFWRRTIEQDESQTVEAAMIESAQGRPKSAQELKNLLLVGCTIVASSFDAIKN